MVSRPSRPSTGAFRVQKDAAGVMLDLAIMETDNLAAELRQLRGDLIAGKHGQVVSEHDLDGLIYACQDRAFQAATASLKRKT